VFVVVVAFPLPAVSAEQQFTDDDRLSREAEFTWLAERGAVTGCAADRRICPHRPVTRLEAAKMIALAGVAEDRWIVGDAVDPAFADLESTWGGEGRRYVDLLAAEAVVSGCAADRFCPHRDLTRGEATAMLVSAFDLTAPPEWPVPYDDVFGSFYAEAARVASFHTLWPLRSGSLAGGNPITRAEFATALVHATGTRLCTADPFSFTRIDSLTRRYPSQRFTAYAWDERDGCHYWMNASNRQSTASVFKVMVMAGTLREAQLAGRGPTVWEMSQMQPMIQQSTNPPVRALWSSFGGAPWFAEQARLFGLVQTTTVGDDETGWGATKTSAADQVHLLRQLILGHGGLLDGPHRAVAEELMSGVIPDQTWGVGTAAPAGSTVFQKNGFAGVTANSVGVVRRADGTRYVMAVLTTGWSHWTSGVPAVDAIAGWAHGALTG